MTERVLTQVAEQLLSRHPASCECFRCRSLRDLLDARAEIAELREGFARPATPESLGAERLARERAESALAEALPVLEAARATSEELERALRWGRERKYTSVAARYAYALTDFVWSVKALLREYDAARAAAGEERLDSGGKARGDR